MNDADVNEPDLLELLDPDRQPPSNTERQYRELLVKHEALLARHNYRMSRHAALAERVRRSRDAWDGHVPELGEKPFAPVGEPMGALLTAVLEVLE